MEMIGVPSKYQAAVCQIFKQTRAITRLDEAEKENKNSCRLEMS